jgi:glycosyltransferase involved in cell wall biosynthesis
MSVSISIIVPVFNSSDFLIKLVEAIDYERVKNSWDLELILVDDGSVDNSFLKIKSLSEKFIFIKGVKLSRNFGHQIAVKTGLTYCTGDYIAVIDDDLQDPPSLLPYFFSFLDKGYDVAYGIRKKRKESFFKKISYKVFYRILKQLSDTKIQLDSGDFCVMKKKVVDNMLKLQEKNPFLRGIRAWVGFNQIGVEYDRSARVQGESGYTLKKLFKIALDGIFSFSNVPIRFITLIGIVGLFFAFAYSTVTIYQNLINNISVKGFTSLVLIISFFSSLILICLGIIGEYIVRIYDEVRNRPFSIIEDSINI